MTGAWFSCGALVIRHSSRVQLPSYRAHPGEENPGSQPGVHVVGGFGPHAAPGSAPFLPVPFAPSASKPSPG